MPFLANLLVQMAQVSNPPDEGLRFILNLWKCTDAENLKAGLKMAIRNVGKDAEKKRKCYHLMSAMLALQPYVSESDLLNMSAAQIKRECARQKITFSKLCDLVGEQFANGALAFPYKRTFMGDVNAGFAELCKLPLKESVARMAPLTVKFRSTKVHFTYRGKHLTLLCGDYKMDWIVDFFTEEQRLSARRKNMALSPADMWRQAGYVAKEILAGLENWTPETIREKFYKVMPECTQFKPSIARSVYMKYSATRVLDFSAGWGDRLIGALSLPQQIVRYVGFDPNSSLRSGHTAMIDRFAAGDPQRHLKYRVLYEPFETYQQPLFGTFDLVFTSPPFFDLETYTNEIGQSILSYPTFEEWINKFLFASLQKAWALLDAGGHMVIHITDFENVKICKRMCTYVIDNLPGAEYYGVCCVAGSVAEHQRPTWVFYKRHL